MGCCIIKWKSFDEEVNSDVRREGKVMNSCNIGDEGNIEIGIKGKDWMGWKDEIIGKWKSKGINSKWKSWNGRKWKNKGDSEIFEKIKKENIENLMEVLDERIYMIK